MRVLKDSRARPLFHSENGPAMRCAVVDMYNAHTTSTVTLLQCELQKRTKRTQLSTQPSRVQLGPNWMSNEREREREGMQEEKEPLIAHNPNVAPMDLLTCIA